jgi:hypothetical protein
VAIYGIGGLGHLGVQYTQIAGATVAAVDVVDAKLELAKRLGAAYTCNSRTEDPAEVFSALGGADVAIVLAATPRAYEQAFASLRPHGTLVGVGLPASQSESPTTTTIPILPIADQGICNDARPSQVTGSRLVGMGIGIQPVPKVGTDPGFGVTLLWLWAECRDLSPGRGVAGALLPEHRQLR